MLGRRRKVVFVGRASNFKLEKTCNTFNRNTAYAVLVSSRWTPRRTVPFALPTSPVPFELRADAVAQKHMAGAGGTILWYSMLHDSGLKLSMHALT